MKNHRVEWIVMMTGICVILGGLQAVALRTQQKFEEINPGGNTSQQSQERTQLMRKIVSLQSEISRLRGSKKDPSAEWDRLNAISCQTPLVGPGIMVSLEDNPQMANNKDSASLQGLGLNYGLIHDVDVLRVVNELFAAHAEAVSVNNQRVGPRTAIRCVGPAILVNQVAVATPFKIEAIGDPGTLLSAMNMTGGVLYELRGVDCIVRLEDHKSLMLPPYDGAVDFKKARPVPTQNPDDGQ